MLNELLSERGCVDLGIPKASTVSDVMIQTRRKKHRQPILNLVEEAIREQKQRKKKIQNKMLLFGEEITLVTNKSSSQKRRGHKFTKLNHKWKAMTISGSHMQLQAMRS